jgi:hypothetical protein
LARYSFTTLSRAAITCLTKPPNILAQTGTNLSGNNNNLPCRTEE